MNKPTASGNNYAEALHFPQAPKSPAVNPAIYLQAALLQQSREPYEFAETRRVGGHGVTWTSVRVYNGPVRSGNTVHHSGSGKAALIAVVALVLVVLVIAGGAA